MMNATRFAYSTAAVQTALRCGDFASDGARLLADAVSHGVRHIWHELPAPHQPARLTDEWFDVAGLLTAELRAARALHETMLRVALPCARDALLMTQRYPMAELRVFVHQLLSRWKLETLPCALLVPDAAPPAADTSWPEFADTLASLRKAGDVLSWGLILPASTPVVDDGWQTAADLGCVALPFHLLNQGTAALASAWRAVDKTVIATRPLAGGALSGNYGAGALFHRFDARATAWTEPMLESLAEACARLAPLVAEPPLAIQTSTAAKRVAAQRLGSREVVARNLPELAVRYVAHQPAFSSVAVGASTRDQLLANLATMGLPALPAALVEELAQPSP